MLMQGGGRLTVLSEQPTLRDQFAMAALTGLLSTSHGQAESVVDQADTAYRYADAMMEARKP